MVKKLEFAWDEGNAFCGKSTVVIRQKTQYSLKYLLALLNSKLFSLVYHSKYQYNAMSGGYMNVSKKQIENFIFYPINFKNKAQEQLHNKIVDNVEKILELKKQFQMAKVPSDKQQTENLANYFIKKIDEMVFELYGLSAEEIKIVSQ
jgi:hypothetical protein